MIIEEGPEVDPHFYGQFLTKAPIKINEDRKTFLTK